MTSQHNGWTGTVSSGSGQPRTNTIPVWRGTLTRTEYRSHLKASAAAKNIAIVTTDQISGTWYSASAKSALDCGDDYKQTIKHSNETFCVSVLGQNQTCCVGVWRQNHQHQRMNCWAAGVHGASSVSSVIPSSVWQVDHCYWTASAPHWVQQRKTNAIQSDVKVWFNIRNTCHFKKNRLYS